MSPAAIDPSSVSSVSAVGLQGQPDLQTLAMLVYMEKGMILEDRTREQMLQMRGQNNYLKELGEVMSESSINQLSDGALDQVNSLSASEKDGKIVVEIGNGYTLEVPKNNTDQSWTLKDKNGISVKIWGDPHVDESDKSGSADWDFKQQSTFVLQDGTKISVGTTPWSGNSSMTVTSSLTITRGDEVVQVKGIDNNQVTFSDSQTGGRQTDTTTHDGYIFYESETGGVADWYTQDAQGNRTEIRADQAMGNAISTEVALETNDIQMSQELKDFLAAHPNIPYSDSDGDGKLTASEFKNLVKSLENERNSLTSTSQMESIQLQSMMGKMTQNSDALSNLISKFAQSMQTIIGNQR